MRSVRLAKYKRLRFLKSIGLSRLQEPPGLIPLRRAAFPISSEFPQNLKIHLALLWKGDGLPVIQNVYFLQLLLTVTYRNNPIFNLVMPVTTCIIEGIECRLEYQKDISDNSYSGMLHGPAPVLFSFSDSEFIPSLKPAHQQLIRNAIKIHEVLRERNE